jgi:hypothetical protein
MKKIYTLFAAMLLLTFAIHAQTLCTIDHADTTVGFSPKPDSFPCIIMGVAFNQTIQAKIQSTYDSTITLPVIGPTQVTFRIDSMRLDSVVGLPTSILWSKNPNILKGGQNGCVNFYGTTTDTVGRYNITGYGTVWLNISALGGQFDTNYVYHGNLSTFPGFGNYYVNVCHHPSGINTFSADLDASISVYPNPNSGTFEFRLESAQKINGELDVYDMTGRRIFNQHVETSGFYSTSIDLSKFAKGLYTLQLRTADGFGSKRISIE